VVREQCAPCRPEEYAAEEAGAQDCGTFEAPYPSADAGRCVERALSRKRRFHARLEGVQFDGLERVQTFGRADGGFWFHQFVEGDESGEACRGFITARSCKTLLVSGPKDQPFAQCQGEPGLSETLCSEAARSTVALGEPAPVAELRCDYHEEEVYSECVTDGGAPFGVDAGGPHLICVERFFGSKRGLKCGPLNVPPLSGDDLLFSRCGRPDAGPPGCLGAPYDAALYRLRSWRSSLDPLLTP